MFSARFCSLPMPIQTSTNMASSSAASAVSQAPAQARRGAGPSLFADGESGSGRPDDSDSYAGGGEYVSVGDVIATESGFLRGHGTVVVDGALRSSVCGFVVRVNKLVSVRPVSSRYEGSVGDVVVGRVAGVGDKRWRVDVNSRQHAVLHLSAIHLADGVQRRRTQEDELHMRENFSESDLISAEVQKVGHDGQVSIHTRSLKYGKLRCGQFLRVPSVLVRRQKQHFHSLRCGVDVILGNNGYLWLSPTGAAADGAPPADAEARRRLCRVRNSVVVLGRAFVPIFVGTINDVYDESVRLGLTEAGMLGPDALVPLTQAAARRAEQMPAA